MNYWSSYWEVKITSYWSKKLFWFEVLYYFRQTSVILFLEDVGIEMSFILFWVCLCSTYSLLSFVNYFVDQMYILQAIESVLICEKWKVLINYCLVLSLQLFYQSNELIFCYWFFSSSYWAVWTDSCYFQIACKLSCFFYYERVFPAAFSSFYCGWFVVLEMKLTFLVFT